MHALVKPICMLSDTPSTKHQVASADPIHCVKCGAELHGMGSAEVDVAAGEAQIQVDQGLVDPAAGDPRSIVDLYDHPAYPWGIRQSLVGVCNEVIRLRRLVKELQGD